MIRQEAQLTISRFVELIDVSRRTYTFRLAKSRAGVSVKGPWPAPIVDVIEPIAAKYVGEWPACPRVARSPGRRLECVTPTRLTARRPASASLGVTRCAR